MDKSQGAIRWVKDRLKSIWLPDGKLSNAAFVTATAAALAITVALILVGRMGYADTDFVPLPPNYGSPSVPSLAAPAAEGTGGTSSTGPFTCATSIGSPEAPVTLFVYSDFLCSVCQRFALTTEKDLEKAYVETGTVRLIYKYFIGNGEKSILVSEAAECAAEQGKFWPYHDLLMQTGLTPETEELNIDYLDNLAGQAGLNVSAFDASLRSGKFKEKVVADDAEARGLGVKGPPTFFVNRMKGSGNKPFEAFQKVINEIIGGSGG